MAGGVCLVGFWRVSPVALEMGVQFDFYHQLFPAGGRRDNVWRFGWSQAWRQNYWKKAFLLLCFVW
jgi:hypothetical protein